LSNEWIPSVDCMSVGREFGVELDVYINDAPSTQVSVIAQKKLRVKRRLTLHQYCPQKLQNEVKLVFSPTLLDFECVDLVSL